MSLRNNPRYLIYLKNKIRKNAMEKYNTNLSENQITQILITDRQINNIDVSLHKYISFLNKESVPQYIYTKPIYYIICENKTGGSWKYIKDLMSNFRNKYIFIKNRRQLYYTKFKSNDKLIVQYLWYMGIRPLDIILTVKKTNIDLILPIHDYYWISNSLYNFHENYRHEYLNKNKKMALDVKELFKVAKYIIHPSKFTYNNFIKFCGNHIISPHGDYEINIHKNIPKINNNIINIGILHEMAEYKGQEQYNYLRENFKHIKINNVRCQIKYLVVNENIPKYNEFEFFNYLTRYNIHGLTLLNKWGETYCYTLTKMLNSGLPIIYNNIGALKERIPDNK